MSVINKISHLPGTGKPSNVPNAGPEPPDFCNPVDKTEDSSISQVNPCFLPSTHFPRKAIRSAYNRISRPSLYCEITGFFFTFSEKGNKQKKKKTNKKP